MRFRDVCRWLAGCIAGVGIGYGCLLVSQRHGVQAKRQEVKTIALHHVFTGLEVWIKRGFAPLEGKRIGLITNPTGIDPNYRSTIDLLAKSKAIRLTALFAPEHGVRGDAGAGESVGSYRDAVTGLPVRTLYGATRKPTPAMLKDIDALVFDIQDIGARSYTFISTMGLCMEAAAEQGIPFCVLDRPNPSGGNRVEGNIPSPEYRSFVGRFPIPYAHGLTVGELAQMINGEGWLGAGKKCDLTVIPMEGWQRDMLWSETGLPWVPTSPHIPHPETAMHYIATGVVGEQPTLNIGVGYTLPFEMAGAPGLSAIRMAQDLNSRNLRGVFFRPAYWKPFYAAYQNKECAGVQIHYTDPRRVELTRINLELMDAARKQNPRLNFFPPGRAAMFDKVCGTDQVRRMFQQGRSSAEIWRAWNADAAAFRRQREPYLLYKQ
jgi:uncharacterized protein YbbC (DUF1343 family)